MVAWPTPMKIFALIHLRTHMLSRNQEIFHSTKIERRKQIEEQLSGTLRMILELQNTSRLIGG